MKSADASASSDADAPKGKLLAFPRLMGGDGRRAELEFLPAALEILETPASPIGRALGGALLLFVAIAIAWAALGHVDIVATAQGKIVPVGRVKMIQPLETGIVTAIHVRDGDKVTAGQVLVELDRTVTTAERNHIAVDLLQARLDAARLAALRAGLGGDLKPVGFIPPAGAPDHQVVRTRAMMTAQAEQQRAKIASLDQQIEQKRAESATLATTIEKLEAGLPLLEETADIRHKARMLEYGNQIADLDAQLRLTDQRNELNVQRRHAVEVDAARAALERQSEEAQAEYAQGIISDLGDAEQKVDELTQDLTKAEKKMQDQVLRTPIDGTVQQLAVHTLGGVVTPAQQLMIIVPASSGIEIEAMVPNKDIGFVHDGDPAEIKVDTFNFTRYGLLHGDVVSVSSDAIIRDKPPAQGSDKAKDNNSTLERSSEPQGQELVYSARIALDRTQMQIDDRMVNLTPGMAVTVEIKTGQRRIIEYVLAPLLRYKQESLRER